MPNNNDQMGGLRRGGQMNPNGLREFLKQKQMQQEQQRPNLGPSGVTDEQWQAAQDKMKEILDKQPKLGNNKSPEETHVDQMSPEELQGLKDDFDQKQQIPVIDAAKLRALQKMRGSGQPPQGF